MMVMMTMALSIQEVLISVKLGHHDDAKISVMLLFVNKTLKAD